MEQKPVYKIKGGLLRGHNEVQIWPSAVVIKQRLKGDQIIPLSAIMEVGTNKSFGDWPFFQATLRIRTAGHTYVVRKLPKGKAQEAKRQIAARLTGVG